MELLNKLERIEQGILSLKEKSKSLALENKELKTEIATLREEIVRKTEAINNLEEQNKIAKLAEGLNPDEDSSALKEQLDTLIAEIDQCIKLVKR